ncbi:MAG: amidase, partial [Cytophagia bacterium]|nr:amidase [Cytophagia bacterium]
MKKLNYVCSLVLAFAFSCQPETKPTRDTSYLEEITVSQLLKGFEAGTFTSEQVVADYLYRIESIDK